MPSPFQTPRMLRLHNAEAVHSKMLKEILNFESHQKMLLKNIQKLTERLNLLKQTTQDLHLEKQRLSHTLSSIHAHLRFYRSQLDLSASAAADSSSFSLPERNQANSKSDHQSAHSHSSNYSSTPPPPPHNCFYYSRCALHRPLKIGVAAAVASSFLPAARHPIIITLLTDARLAHHLTANLSEACLVFAHSSHTQWITKHAHNLRLRAANLVVFDDLEVARQSGGARITSSYLPQFCILRVASEFSPPNEFRRLLDVRIPSLFTNERDEEEKIEWEENANMTTQTLPLLVPIRRQHLLCYHGDDGDDATIGKLSRRDLEFAEILRLLRSHSKSFVYSPSNSNGEHAANTSDSFDWLSAAPISPSNQQQKQLLLRQFYSRCMFCVLPITMPTSRRRSVAFEYHLVACLRGGSIPLVIGARDAGEETTSSRLPLAEMIPWESAVILVEQHEKEQLGGLSPHLVGRLAAMSPPRIFQMRLNGRAILDKHFSSVHRLATSIIALFAVRLRLAPSIISNNNNYSTYSNNSSSNALFKLSDALREKLLAKYRPFMAPVKLTDPYLGPIDPPIDSLPSSSSFLFSSSPPINPASALPVMLPVDWLSFEAAAHSNSHTNTPWDPIGLPWQQHTRQQHAHQQHAQYRPISSVPEFQHNLGGNRPYEQFTVVLLTNRAQRTTQNWLSVLRATLALLHNLPYLHSVLIVLNAGGPHSDDATPPLATLPRLHAPIRVLRAPHNSLNNRFALPALLTHIHTEAVFSIDDDMQLRHDEIMLAFRVWRDNPQRIVGFPARFHQFVEGERWNAAATNSSSASEQSQKEREKKVAEWDFSSLHYNANLSCEYSMVLTGAAFLHRFYFWAYSYWPHMTALRRIVDQSRNCEDIAMNFLVAHITAQPPIKVAGRYSFPSLANRWGGGAGVNGGAALHTRASHYADCTRCLRKFARIFGYLPLRNSQSRADSVLYRTRLPPHQQKCFRLV